MLFPCWEIVFSTIGGGILREVFAYAMRKRKYSNVIKSLERHISNLDYNAFKNDIYAVKALDIQERKDYWSKIQQKYHINDSILSENGKEIFEAKFNQHWDFDYQRKEISKIIQEELSLTFNGLNHPNRNWD